MLEPLTVDEILEATGGRFAAPPSDDVTAVTGISTDTRSLQPGELYLSLTGKNFDGHAFAPQALNRGAAYVMAAREALARCEADHGRTIVVDDTLSSYHRIAAHYRGKFRLPVVAITGSYGKTTTKDLMAAVLTTHYPCVLKTAANLNNEYGVPQTLLRIDHATRAAVIEMAMRGRDQIRPLATITRPDIGIITTIGEAHLELLGSLEAICDAKAELLTQLAPNACAVLPRDSAWYDRLASQTPCRIVTFGRDPRADVRLLEAVPEGVEGQRVQLEVKGVALTLHLPMPGPHNAMNLAATVAAAVELGIPLTALERFPDFLETSGRRHEIVHAAGGFELINDAYNAGPASMHAALDTLSEVPVEGRRGAVLADMLELGPTGPDYHRAVGEHAARAVDFLITTGTLGRCIAEAATAAGLAQVFHAPDRAAAAQRAAEWARPGDLVLVKASRGMQLDEVVKTLAAQTGERE